MLRKEHAAFSRHVRPITCYLSRADCKNSDELEKSPCSCALWTSEGHVTPSTESGCGWSSHAVAYQRRCYPLSACYTTACKLAGALSTARSRNLFAIPEGCGVTPRTAERMCDITASIQSLRRYPKDRGKDVPYHRFHPKFAALPQGPRKGCAISPLPLNVSFPAAIHGILERFSDDTDIVRDLVRLGLWTSVAHDYERQEGGNVEAAREKTKEPRKGRNKYSQEKTN